MGFDKDYPNRKDKRKAYYGPKAVDRTCRNHGSCAYCAGGREYKVKRNEPIAENHEG
jgi:hypothetical protein